MVPKKFQYLILFIKLFVGVNSFRIVKIHRRSEIPLINQQIYNSTEYEYKNNNFTSENNTGFSPMIPSDLVSASSNLVSSFESNTLAPRLFPIGSPDLVPATSNLISPFDPSTFSQQLLPLISANIKHKVKELAHKFHAGADVIENALKEEWKESLLNPQNLRYLLWRYKYLHPPLLPTAALFKQYPTTYYRIPPGVHHPTIITNLESFVKGKYPNVLYKNQKPGNEKPVNIVMKELGIENYRKFEEQILRDIEKREELKVEATLHTLYDDEPEVVKGKPHKYVGWKPLEPTKNYDTNSIHSQIVSPLHTSFSGKLHSGLENSEFLNNHNVYKNHHYNVHNAFESFVDHDDNPYQNHRPYEIHEQSEESAFRPIKASPQFDEDFEDIPVVPITTHKPKLILPTRTVQNYEPRKRTRQKTSSLDNVSIPESKFTETNELTTGRKQSSRTNIIRHHIQSLTTSRPKLALHSRNESSELIAESSKDSPSTVENITPSSTNERSQRIPKYQGAASYLTPTIVARGTSSSLQKPSRHVPRSTSSTKFLDKARVSGSRGSIKFNSQKDTT